MKYEAVLFDLDGTLIHTTPQYRYEVVGSVLKHFAKPFSKTLIDRFWFESHRNNLITKHLGIDPKEFWLMYEKHEVVQKRRLHIHAYSDVEFVSFIRKLGIKTGIVTGAPRHIAEMEIGLLGFEKFDHYTVARYSEGIKAKPDPQGLHECLQKLDVSASKAMFIGNGQEDIDAAKAAGLFDVHIERKEYPLPKKTIPSLQINSLFELKALVGIK